jgi:hypothetical protein
MNYHYADWVYREYGLQDKLSDDYFNKTGREIAAACRKSGIDCRSAF